VTVDRLLRAVSRLSGLSVSRYDTYMEKTLHTDTYIRYSQGPQSARCLVFDADDTLAVFDPVLRLGGCDRFAPRPELDLARAAHGHGFDIIVATARPCWTAQKTLKWLRKHNLPVTALYLKNRANFDIQAHDLKVEMLRDIQETWEVECFYDDSPFTIAAAKALGVNAKYVAGNESYWRSKGQLPS
jgi:hypothetical protein